MASLATPRRGAHVQPMDMQPAPMDARLVVMMTRADKASIERRARTLDLSTSELVRRAAQSYEEISPEQEKMLGALADELEGAVVSMRSNLKQARDAMDDYRTEMAQLRASR